MKLKIGENIRRFRRDADLTQQQFAEQMGVTCQSVSRWENGETYPDTELLPAIADYFHVSVDRLMGVSVVNVASRPSERSAFTSAFIFSASSSE